MTKNEMELAPLRDLQDFLLGSARFQLPNYKDLDKWSNRVVQNLLYYQTNYFIMSILIVLVIGALHPLKMFYGGLGFGVLLFLLSYFNDPTSPITRFKKEHPMLGSVLMLCGACMIFYLLNSLLVFLFGILLPLAVTFIHASLRLRNLKNKVSSIERVISNKTPMGVLLEALGAFCHALTSLLLQKEKYKEIKKISLQLN